jgi:hypothetical protein
LKNRGIPGRENRFDVVVVEIPPACTGCLPPQQNSEHFSAEPFKEKFITGQNEREETTQDAIVTKSAAFASYEINYLTYITATYTRAKRRFSIIGSKARGNGVPLPTV